MLSTRSKSLIFILVAASFVMKLIWIEHKELAHDEPFTVLQAHRTIAGLFAILPEENNPPLHFILVHFWLKLVPPEAGWLRLPSALFSALTIWPLFLLGRSLANQRVAITASLLFFFSSYHFGFASEVRAYSLFALLATTGMWQLARVTQGRNMIWLMVVNMLMVYTHFFGWLMVGIQFLCVIALPEWRPFIGRYLRALAISVVAYLPYAYIFLIRFSTSVGEGTWLAQPDPEEIYNMLWRWSNVPVAVVFLLAVILIHCIGTRVRELLTRLGLIWAFVPLLAMFAASYLAPMFLDRYLIYASPGYYLLCAMALDHRISIGRLHHAPAAIAVGIMAFTFTPWDNSWPVPSKVIRATGELRSNSDIPVLIHPRWYAHTYAWHTDRTLFEDPDRLEETLEERNIHTLSDLGDLNSELQAQQEIILIVAGAEEDRRFNVLRENHPMDVIQSMHPHEHVRVHHIRLRTDE